jgi:hypothetical protein
LERTGPNLSLWLRAKWNCSSSSYKNEYTLRASAQKTVIRIAELREKGLSPISVNC